MTEPREGSARQQALSLVAKARTADTVAAAIETLPEGDPEVGENVRTLRAVGRTPGERVFQAPDCPFQIGRRAPTDGPLAGSS